MKGEICGRILVLWGITSVSVVFEVTESDKITSVSESRHGQRAKGGAGIRTRIQPILHNRRFQRELCLNILKQYYFKWSRHSNHLHGLLTHRFLGPRTITPNPEHPGLPENVHI